MGVCCFLWVFFDAIILQYCSLFGVTTGSLDKQCSAEIEENREMKHGDIKHWFGAQVQSLSQVLVKVISSRYSLATKKMEFCIFAGT